MKKKMHWLHPIAILFYCSVASASFLIPNLGVTTAKLANSSVTTAKLGIAAGSITTPAYNFTADTNTGIYSPAADSIGIVGGGVEKWRVDSSGNFTSVVPSGSTLLPKFDVRAWVNFSSASLNTVSGTYSRTSPSTTLTITLTAHGHSVGQAIYADFTSGTGADGGYEVVSVPDANTFTITTVASTTTSGNVTLNRATIRGSGNVNSVYRFATGDYIINFETGMPDTNYAISCGGNGTFTSLSSFDMSNAIAGCTFATAKYFQMTTQNPNDGVNVNNANLFAIVYR